jgi:hypothetical protein
MFTSGKPLATERRVCTIKCTRSVSIRLKPAAVFVRDSETMSALLPAS